MTDNYCAGFMIEHETEDDTDENMKPIVIGCKHPAWRLIFVGLPLPDLGDFGWVCTKCGKVLRGLNPFKESEKVSKEEFHE